MLLELVSGEVVMFNYVLFRKLLLSIILTLTPLCGNAMGIDGIEFDKSLSVEVREGIDLALETLSKLKGTKASPMHESTFHGPVSGSVYLQWLKSRINKIEMSPYDCEPPLQHFMSKIFSKEKDAKALACADTANHTFWLTAEGARLIEREYRDAQNRKTVDLSNWIRTLEIIFHEARHFDGADHVICPANFQRDELDLFPSFVSGEVAGALNGSHACDDDEYGSYATTTIMFFNIAKFCENCSQREKNVSIKEALRTVTRIKVASARMRLQQDLLTGNELVFALREKNHKAVAKYLDQIKGTGNKHLLMFVKMGEEMFMQAIAAGLDISTPDEAGDSPLFRVVSSMEVSSYQAMAIDILIKSGADINARDRKGLNLMDRAIEYPTQYTVINALLKLGLKPSSLGQKDFEEYLTHHSKLIPNYLETLKILRSSTQ